MSSDDSRNPFIVKLWWSFHDADNLYLVLDFLPGGDLATQLSRWGRLGRDRARFYTCEIVEGVEALHAAGELFVEADPSGSRLIHQIVGVIYRDLKPGMCTRPHAEFAFPLTVLTAHAENVLLNSDGHVSLADFGLAAEFPDSQGPLAALPPWMGGTPVKSDDNRPKLARHATAGADQSTAAARDTATSFVGTAEYLVSSTISRRNKGCSQRVPFVGTGSHQRPAVFV